MRLIFWIVLFKVFTYKIILDDIIRVSLQYVKEI